MTAITQNWLENYLRTRVMTGGNHTKGVSPISIFPPQDLTSYFERIDFVDKSVLISLAVPECVFLARHLGAKRVDAFYTSELELYGYYFLLWTRKYKNSLYPDLTNRNYLSRLLKRVQEREKLNAQEEKDALDFFIKHLQNETDFSLLFNHYSGSQTLSLPYTYSKDKASLESPSSVFQFDLSQERLLLPQIYDLVVLNSPSTDNTTGNYLEENKVKLMNPFSDSAVLTFHNNGASITKRF